MRIVGGRWRGRPIAGPATGTIRPTSDRLREAIFNILLHAYGEPAPETRVLDLFAGTGALGLEALSRGAGHAVFVDDGQEARGLVRQNIEALGAGGTTRLFRRDASQMGPAAPNAPFSLVFCDPPYRRDLAGPALLACQAGGWLTPDALVVVEEAADSGFIFPPGFDELDRRTYGETEVVFGRAAGRHSGE